MQGLQNAINVLTDTSDNLQKKIAEVRQAVEDGEEKEYILELIYRCEEMC